MSRPWEYPRWRRILMQTLMWVILAGTVGLAQLVTTHQRRHTTVTLAAPVRLGPIVVRIPEGWESSKTLTKDENLIECLDPETHRMLRILVMRVPLEGDDQQDADSKGIALASEPIDFSGLGIRSSMTVARQSRITADGMVTVTSLGAAAQLQSGLSVTIELDELGIRLASADKSLVRAVAGAITAAPGRRLEVPPASQRPSSDSGDED